jgi:hypothetical protein
VGELSPESAGGLIPESVGGFAGIVTLEKVFSKYGVNLN